MLKQVICSSGQSGQTWRFLSVCLAICAGFSLGDGWAQRVASPESYDQFFRDLEKARVETLQQHYVASVNEDGAGGELVGNGPAITGPLAPDDEPLPPQDTIQFVPEEEGIRVMIQSPDGDERYRIAPAGVDDGAPVSRGQAWVPETVDPLARTKASESPGERALREKREQLANRRITLNLKDVDLQNLVRWLSTYEAGLNVVIPPEYAKEPVTLYMEDVPILDALDSILKSRDLTFIIEPGGILRVIPLSRVERTERVMTQTMHYKLNWIRAADVRTALEPILRGGSGGGSDGEVSMEPRTNTIIISAPPPMLEQMQRIILALDQADKQVDLEARFVELTQSAGRDLGMAWNIYKDNKFGVSPNLHGWDAAGFRRALVDPGRATELATSGATWEWGRTMEVFNQDYNVALRIDAFEDRGEAETLANPRVTTLNNVPATINLNTEIPYEQVTNDPGGQTTVQAAYKPVGIMMQITPVITNDNMVSLNITAEQTILERMQNLPRAGDVPVVKNRRSETNVIVPNKGTAALLGLRQLDTSLSQGGVPWVSRIPVLGWLFKSTNDSQRKQDLALFVTPHVIESATIPQEWQDKYDRIDQRWDLPDYFFDDVSMPSDSQIQ